MGSRVILFVSEALDASPTRYRATAFFEPLRRHGWEPRHITVVGLFRRLVLLHAVREARVVVVLRKLFTPALCRLLRGRGRRLILDIDDALFAREDGTRALERERRFAGTARSVDAVWAGNEYLAKIAGQSCPTAVVLPTAIEPASYVNRTQPPVAYFDLVWIGSSSTRKYLEELLPVLGKAAWEIPNLRLKIVADFDLPGASALGVPTLPVRWSTATEGADVAGAQVGISPMPDNPWTRGKCGLKVLQYMAAGLPVVASASGVHRDIILDGQTGFLASDAAAWIAALRRLRSDPVLRAKMGAAGRQRVIEYYSVAATFAKMLPSLETLAAPLIPRGKRYERV